MARELLTVSRGLKDMTRSTAPLSALSAIALLAACSSETAPVAESPSPEASASTAAPAPDPALTGTPAANPVLTLEGFGDLVIGKPVPAGSSFAKRGAQASDLCLIYSSPEYPGVYAIVEEGAVRRVTVQRDSTVKLVEGIGVDATEKDVLAAFPGFVASPHTYVEAPAKYLQQPGSDPRLRFEIDEKGLVSAIHTGTRPQLEYVEGCA